VAFNRSWDAFNANPDAFVRVDEASRDRAVDRRMTLVRFDEPDGTPIATVNWFAVHCTSVHADNHFLHSDNKGMAALELEDRGASMGQPDYVAVFAQGAAGDVSPNLRWDDSRGRTVGLHDDDFRSAAANGAIQAEHARRLLNDAAQEDIAEGPIDGVLRYVDFHHAPVDAQFADGRPGRHTGLARMGMPFLEGTKEGPGPLVNARPLTRALTRLVRWQKDRRARTGRDPDGALDSHGPMAPFLELGRGGEGRAFGAFSMGRPILPGWFDPTVAEVKRLTRLEALGDRPWIPHRLPVQIVRIGPLAIAALPCEPTTMCGVRIEQQVRAALRDIGVEHVVVAGYANSYASYVTTFEEYQLQRYEGGSTLFGQWTLGAYQTAFDDLATALHTRADERTIEPGPRPPSISDHELDARHPDRIPERTTWFR
jgi:neutral ceramidase